MEQNKPITRHAELYRTLVAAGSFHFPSLREYRTHASVRHVRFHRDMRPRKRFPSSVGQPEGHRNGTDTRWFGGDFVLNPDRRRRGGRPGTVDGE